MEKDLYREMYELEAVHWWFRARLAIVLRLVDAGMRGRPRPAFLDVGCGTGGTLRELEKRGTAVGLDSSEDALAFAATRTGARLIRGVVPDDLYAMRERYDCVLLLDVLEHVEEDGASLRAAAGLLKEDGILLATVPAHAWLYAPRDEYHCHRRRYTRRGLSELMAGAGLKADILSYYNCFLFAPAAAGRLWSRWRRVEAGLDLSLPPAPINGLLRAIFGAERFLLPRISLPWGLSVIALGRPAP